MANVLSFPKSIMHWLANNVISPIRHTLLIDLITNVLHRLKRLWTHDTRFIRRGGLGIWLFATTGASLLLVWNGILLFALAMGFGTTLIVHHYYANLMALWQQVTKWVSGSHSIVVISSCCGLFSLVASYLTLLIWQDTNSVGLALSILLQGLGLLTLGLFVRQLQQEKQIRLPSQLDNWIQNLTALDPLKRLIAVRQIRHYVDTSSADTQQIQELKEYLQLLLKQEPEPSIQNAILEGLEQINLAHQPQ